MEISTNKRMYFDYTHMNIEEKEKKLLLYVKNYCIDLL